MAVNPESCPFLLGSSRRRSWGRLQDGALLQWFLFRCTCCQGKNEPLIEQNNHEHHNSVTFSAQTAPLTSKTSKRQMSEEICQAVVGGSGCQGESAQWLDPVQVPHPLLGSIYRQCHTSKTGDWVQSVQWQLAPTPGLVMSRGVKLVPSWGGGGV